MLHIVLLGPPRYSVDGRSLNLGRRRCEAILAYLAVTGQPQHRASLAALFWPESRSDRALANLRRDLSVLRRALDQGCLGTEGELVWLADGCFQLDVSQFRSQSNAATHDRDDPIAALARVVATYGGPFMSGFTLPDCPEFDEWQFFLREELATIQASLLERLVMLHTEVGQIDAAIEHARQLLALDPLVESTHRTLMLLYAQQGNWTAAVRQYDMCTKLFADELGIPPSQETTALYAEVKTRRLDGVVAPGSAASAAAHISEARPRIPASRIHHLPPQLTPLIGRTRELAELTQLLTDDSVRLITILGLGGVGKSRLALESAAQHAPAFRHGVCYIALTPVTDPDALAAIIAGALELAPASLPLPQIIDFLHNRNMLLVLDNFEHLLPATETLQKLLQAAPHLKILCTSRVRLALQIEHVLALRGLETPQKDAPVETIARTASVHLFLHQARRVHHGFSLSAANAGNIAAICRLAEGMPLALLLAAAWTDLLSCEEIARQMDAGIDFLAMDLHDLPERHHSLRAVFDSTWRMLSAGEQAIFVRLAAFTGGFSALAAATVAKASLRDLRRLHDKSLIQRAATGRFQIHELLRQYAGERLAQDLDEALGIGQEHAAFFVKLVETHGPALKGRNQLIAATTLGQDLENIRQAWHWAATHRRIDLLMRALEGLCLFHDFRGSTGMGITDCQALIKALDRHVPSDEEIDGQATKMLMAAALLWLGIFQRDRGRSAAAQEAWRQCTHLLDGLPPTAPAVRHTQAALLMHQGIAAVRSGDYDAAHADYADAEALLRASDTSWELGLTLLEHATVYWHWNRYSEGRPLCEEALTILHDLGDSAGYSDALMRMGLLELGDGHIDAAETMLRRSVALARAHSPDRINILTVQNILGWVLILAGKYPEAVELAEGAMRAAEDLGNRYWSSMCHWTTALALLNLGEFGRARRLLTEGLALARAMDYARGQSNILVLLAWLDMIDEQLESAATQLAASVPLVEAIGHKDELAQAQVSLALVHLLTGDVSAAQPLLQQALANATETGAYLALTVCLPVVARFFAATHRPDVALSLHFVAEAQPLWRASAWYAALFRPCFHEIAARTPAHQVTALRAQAPVQTPLAALLHVQDKLTETTRDSA